jgi:lysylphosphatidylglycerol synthetase-like protein (DUF2156 family)
MNEPASGSRRTRGAAATDAVEVPDVATVGVGPGTRAVVVSDLHLGARPNAVSTAVSSEVARTLDAWTGPGVLVLAGDVFELLAGPPDVTAALTAHRDFADALERFVRATEPDRTIVVLAGNHDGRLAWDGRARRDLERRLGDPAPHRLVHALAVDLAVETGAGIRVVRVEHGHRLDPVNALHDPRDPSETPLGAYVVTELLPALPDKPWMAGVESLSDPSALPAFVASRIAYRTLARPLAWLVVPLAVAALLRAPLRWELAAGAVVADLVLVAAVLALVARRAWGALADLAGRAGGGRGDQNDAPRDEARALVTGGHAGLVTGHTHQPELTPLGDGFYANAGCGARVIDAAPARLGLPPVFAPVRRLSWLELEAGADLHVRLLHSEIDLPGATVLERLAARRRGRGRVATAAGSARPAVVAALSCGTPAGEQVRSWPPVADPALHHRRVRRAAATAIGAAGLLDVASALTPPLRARLHVVVGIVPLAVPQAAAALVALAGLSLLALARGVRRGQRHAWATAVALLTGTVVLHLVKGGDVEEAAVAAALAGWLVHHRRDFRAAVDRPSLRRGLLGVTAGGALAFTVGTIAARVFGHVGALTAMQAAGERLAGVTSTRLTDRVDDFLTPTLAATGFALLASLGWMAFRPVVQHRRDRDRESTRRARDIVARHGRDTLAYFALRDDKELFFSGDTLVAYAVLGGVALVSPDPIGPPAERDRAWRAFRAFAGDRGWTVAVMGASEEWLPVYRACGMRDLYVGDEAVVDAATFRIEGGDRKPLRQAVNRVERAGYTVAFFTPATLPGDVRAGLARILVESRRGDVERGFSMTLGRAFDAAADPDVLLAVAFGPDGVPAAFCQYVPAPGIDGWSLDLMRRSDGDHPNGLTDFVVVRTLDWMRAEGYRGLGLNFATMRAVLAGEAGGGLGTRVEQRLLQRLGDSMQIESLWRYNAKFGPAWVPRHAVYEAPEHMLAAALAVARAESFWELPVIGRFLVPPPSAGAVAAEPVPGAADGLDGVAPERPVDLVAQVADVDVDDVRRAGEGEVPHVLEQVRPAEHDTGVAHELGEEGELLR